MSQGREVHESTPVSRVMWSWDVARAGVVMPRWRRTWSPRAACAASDRSFGNGGRNGSGWSWRGLRRGLIFPPDG